MSSLFVRRQVWLPTLWGWLLLLCVLATLGATASLQVVGFLSVTEPARGSNQQDATTLVIEGWLEPTELNQCATAFRRGRYARVLTAGGPITSWSDEPRWPTHAERASAYLKAHGLGGVEVTAVPAPASMQERTFVSAVMVREWARRSGVTLDAVDVCSAGVHARRSRLLYRIALGPTVEVGAIAATTENVDAAWWRTSAEAKNTAGEVLGLLWTLCCFRPASPGSLNERWAVPGAPV